MSPVRTDLPTLAAFLSTCGALLVWPLLAARWRRALALLASAAGLVFLFVALGAEGQREAAATGSFLMGPAYVVHVASVSASLPFYVMTAVCLLLGTAGLAAVSDDRARRLRARWWWFALALSWTVTLLRFALEKAAAPPAWTRAVGITWLAPLIGAFFALKIRAEGRGMRALAWALLSHGLAARVWVAGLYVVATAFALGTHYDLSTAPAEVRDPVAGTHWLEPGSLAQVLALGVLPQLVAWPLWTMAAGLAGALPAWLGALAWERLRNGGLRPAVAAAPER